MIDSKNVCTGAETDEELLTLKEFAHLFGRQPESVRVRARRGWAAAVKIAGQWYVRVPSRDAIARRHALLGKVV